MGARRTMNRRAEERRRRMQAKVDKVFSWQGIRDYRVKVLLERVRELEAALMDPEGTIQRGLNERYRRDLREREMEHHADWDAEVGVHRRAAARWMRGEAARVADGEGFFAIGAAIEALPLEPGGG